MYSVGGLEVFIAFYRRNLQTVDGCRVLFGDIGNFEAAHFCLHLVYLDVAWDVLDFVFVSIPDLDAGQQLVLRDRVRFVIGDEVQILRRCILAVLYFRKEAYQEWCGQEHGDNNSD